MFEDAQMFWRFATGLHRFLASPLPPSACRDILEESLRNRPHNFLRLMRRAVFDYPRSPYLALFRWAGVEYGDLERMVNADGVEATLEKLFDAGVRVSLEEFKGRRPLERRGLNLPVTDADFDNPLLAREFESLSGGSTGPRRRMHIDFDLLTYDAACKFLFHQAHGVEKRPFGLWRAVPPGSSGMKNALVAIKLGHSVERWFSPLPVEWNRRMFKSAVFTTYAVYGPRLMGHPMPAPEYVPLDAPAPVARWLAEKARAGTPALLSLAANGAARTCIAARDHGLDISGTIFRVGGEPFTSAKLSLLRQAGASHISGWAMSESGPLGAGCAARDAVDEVHLLAGKVALLQRPRALPGGDLIVDALYLTTLLPSTPKIMLNLDSGDYAAVSRRRCGCPLEQFGLDLHLHTIRSYEKLTTGGMHFMGGALLKLIEEVLPAAHGGCPSDYQLVEREHDAVSRVCLIVSPRVGPVDESAVVTTVLEFLGSDSRSDRSMAAQWRQGRSVQVERREPYISPAGKIPPLQVLREQDCL